MRTEYLSQRTEILIAPCEFAIDLKSEKGDKVATDTVQAKRPRVLPEPEKTVENPKKNEKRRKDKERYLPIVNETPKSYVARFAT